jgi:hypothetical protein
MSFASGAPARAVTPASAVPSPAARLSPRSERLKDDRRGLQLATGLGVLDREPTIGAVIDGCAL